MVCYLSISRYKYRPGLLIRIEIPAGFSWSDLESKIGISDFKIRFKNKKEKYV